MPAAPPPPVPTRTVEVETPEQVLLDFELADLGSRFLALVADGAVLATTVVGLVALAWGLSELFGGIPPWLEGWTAAVWILLLFVVVFGYFILFEGLADGRTLGKRWVGIRVMHDGGHPITFRGSAIRNLVRLVDLQPLVSGLVGGATMMVHPYTKRLGDLAAGTVVVRDRGRTSLREALEAFEAPAEPTTLPLEPRLDEERFVALERFVARRDELAPEARERLAGSLLERLDAADAAVDETVADDPADAVAVGDPVDRLVALYEEEDTRRRAVGGGGRHGRQAVRLIQRQREAWLDYEALLERAGRRGLSSLGEAELPRFAALYRLAAADLARLRTYRGPGEVTFALERRVQGGHNLLYRSEGQSWGQLLVWIRGGFPSLVRTRWAVVAIAAASLLLPAAVTYGLVRYDPGVARAILPAEMVIRAERAPARLAAGEGYVDVPEVFMPTTSSQLIANNVRVTFLVFAGGVLAGLGSVAILVLNGVFFGGVLGLYDAYGAGVLIWSFVAPHGVIELLAIFIAGGAGIWMGSALLLPGRRTRGEALEHRAREAVSLIAGTTVLLVLAGLVEGFVSPAPVPAALRLSVAAVLAVAVFVYLARAGRDVAAEAPATAAPGISRRGTGSPPR